ncbi:hypothetical protein [Pareuzebyella sediminis]|uniref:hypothetical protein n=1 Tax=Pareuzebyella sediminis TaxID=2607998 RepID=UPI0011ECF888|nr:hypothetical protein [Pareuzebyella sediminis]
MNRRPIILALMAYFDGTDFFGPNSGLDRTKRDRDQFKYDGWFSRDIYIQHIFEWLDINKELAVDDRQTTEEVIREYFKLQAWMDPQLPLDRSGKLDEIKLDSISQSAKEKLKVYDEMAEKVVAIFKSYDW